MGRSFRQRLQESLSRLQAVQEEHEAEAQAEAEEEAHTSSAHAGGGLKSKFHKSFQGDQVANLDLAAEIARAASGGSGGSGGGDDNDEDDQLWSRFGLANTASRSSTIPSDHSRAFQDSALTETIDRKRDEIFARWPLNFTLDVSGLTEQCDGDLDVISDVLAESVTQGAKSIDSLEAAINVDTEQLSYHSVSPPLSPTLLSTPHTPEFCARTSLWLGPTSIELCPAESPLAFSMRPVG
jgi:hypothetical protein